LNLRNHTSEEIFKLKKIGLVPRFKSKKRSTLPWYPSFPIWKDWTMQKTRLSSFLTGFLTHLCNYSDQVV
jgi:hypothetical protein